MKMIFKNTTATIFLSLMLAVSGCTTLAIDASFVLQVENRRAFVESIIFGQTTRRELVSRWGNVTSGSTVGSGNTPDKSWNWSGSSSLGNGAYITIVVDHTDLVKSVESGTFSNSKIDSKDNFKPSANTVIVTSSEPSAPTEQASLRQQFTKATPLKLKASDLNEDLVDEMRAYAEKGASLAQFKAKYGEPTYEGSYQRLFVQTVTTLYYGNRDAKFNSGPNANHLRMEFTDGKYSDTSGGLASASGELKYY